MGGIMKTGTCCRLHSVMLFAPLFVRRVPHHSAAGAGPLSLSCSFLLFFAPSLPPGIYITSLCLQASPFLPSLPHLPIRSLVSHYSPSHTFPCFQCQDHHHPFPLTHYFCIFAIFIFCYFFKPSLLISCLYSCICILAHLFSANMSNSSPLFLAPTSIPCTVPHPLFLGELTFLRCSSPLFWGVPHPFLLAPLHCSFLFFLVPSTVLHPFFWSPALFLTPFFGPQHCSSSLLFGSLGLFLTPFF